MQQHRALRVLSGLLLSPLPACGGGSVPGFQLGSDEGGSTYGFDGFPFDIRRADGQVMHGHATVRFNRVEFLAKNKAGTTVCSRGFSL